MKPGCLLVLLLSLDRTGSTEVCQHVYTRIVPRGGTEHILFSASGTTLIVQKFNDTSEQWVDIIISINGKTNHLGSITDISVTEQYFRVENVSQETRGKYMVKHDLSDECVALIHLIVQDSEPTELPPVSEIPSLQEEKDGEKNAKPSFVSATILMIVLTVVCVFLICLIWRLRTFYSSQEQKLKFQGIWHSPYEQKTPGLLT
ncbi:uncharacterized protein LOC135974917 [Chrysemys picta bellii]|uniref:uncharacterized protein LOC135974917 n=1 Tax=Chrysemys picta bellii TaxID=8478 RepID=UPI0032B1CCF6